MSYLLFWAALFLISTPVQGWVGMGVPSLFLLRFNLIPSYSEQSLLWILLLSSRSAHFKYQDRYRATFQFNTINECIFSDENCPEEGEWLNQIWCLALTPVPGGISISLTQIMESFILLIDNTSFIFHIYCGQIPKSTNWVADTPPCDPVEWFSHPKLHRRWHYQKEANYFVSGWEKLFLLISRSPHTGAEVVQMNMSEMRNVGDSFSNCCALEWNICQHAAHVCRSALSTEAAWLTAPPNLYQLQIIQDNTVIVLEYTVFYSLQRALIH